MIKIDLFKNLSRDGPGIMLVLVGPDNRGEKAHRFRIHPSYAITDFPPKVGFLNARHDITGAVAPGAVVVAQEIVFRGIADGDGLVQTLDDRHEFPKEEPSAENRVGFVRGGRVPTDGLEKLIVLIAIGRVLVETAERVNQPPVRRLHGRQSGMQGAKGPALSETNLSTMPPLAGMVLAGKMRLKASRDRTSMMLAKLGACVLTSLVALSHKASMLHAFRLATITQTAGMILAITGITTMDGEGAPRALAIVLRALVARYRGSAFMTGMTRAQMSLLLDGLAAPHASPCPAIMEPTIASGDGRSTCGTGMKFETEIRLLLDGLAAPPAGPCPAVVEPTDVVGGEASRHAAGMFLAILAPLDLDLILA